MVTVTFLAAASLVEFPAPVAASTPPEFAAVTTVCIGVPEAPLAPGVLVRLYNVPTGASPRVSGTMRAPDGATAPLNLGEGFQVASTPGTWTLGAAQFAQIAPILTSSGVPVAVALTWTDGLGGSGNHTQVVGIPTCATSRPRIHVAMATNQGGTVYWVATTTGAVSGFDQTYQSGQARNYGDLSPLPLNAPIVGMAALPDGQGYWLVGADGGVFSFGLAQFYGSTGGLKLNAPIVGMAATPDGAGYWLVASDGGVFAFGDARFYGSMGGQLLNQPVVGVAADEVTGGYWLVAADGGIFSFNAPFYGSTGGLTLNQPVVGMEAAPDGSGYRLGARDGGVFSFNLTFAGSYAGQDPHPVVAITGTGSNGYRLMDSCGGVYDFGSAQFYGASVEC